MSTCDFQNVHLLQDEEKNIILHNTNLMLKNFSTEKRIIWALKNLPNVQIMSSSFGIQSSVLLHLMVQYKPDIPVILIDTGYLFPQTYHFIDMLTKKFTLNLKVFRSYISPAWQEARYGKLWKQDVRGINLYNMINKVRPMNEAFNQLSVGTWFSGLRRIQSSSRSKLQYISIQKNIVKILPILDWSNKKVDEYLKKNNLEYHPLWKEGYRSIGDIHTTKKYKKGMLEEDTRFFGLKRECGLHES
ncbi:phosphoadenylyl-sulfate reductase [Buchnera aphidicola]|uniref:phosphoadenylyl-sulfate reductase n=1 Tax=Buchnera aphidicola TaxID=9 RepID=UPI003463AA03